MSKKEPRKTGKVQDEKVEKKVKDLNTKLEAKEKEAEDYLEMLKRLKAEFENYKKRMVKEQTRMVDIVSEELILKVVPVIDNLERALEAAEDNHDADKLIEGIQMVDSQFKAILKKEGLEEITPHGEVFNPERHEAVMSLHSDEHEEDTVIEVLQKGYKYRGKLLKPAMVKVCKKVEGKEECEIETEVE